MRRTIVAGLLAAGMLMGCGGSDDTERTVTASAPPPCEDQCYIRNELCLDWAETPDDEAQCAAALRICVDKCPPVPWPGDAAQR